MYIININQYLRLRKIEDKDFQFLLPYYQDKEILMLVNGSEKVYDMSILKRMVDYLNNNGDCYVIEHFNDRWKIIGDVSLLEGTSDDLPIMIGDKSLHRKGIGRLVVSKIIEIAKEKGRKTLKVECYDFNESSIGLYTSLGFNKTTKTEIGHIYIKNLSI